uniref:Serine hydrolase like n=1 Tax=Acanthochromis polyacanthus TaxID=80966 RepID=A0A3Q1EGD0_9TELE
MSTTVKQAVSELSVLVPWGEIRGKAWGPDHGHPVLCLHGWADNCGSFNTLIPLLPTECRYVAVDMPGHGLSSHRPPGVFYSFPAYVADVRRVVDDLGWTKFSIIGHSMGSNIAAMFSALFPEVVDGLVLLDFPGFFPTVMSDIPKIMKQGIEEMLQFDKGKKDNQRVYTYEKAAERLSTANPTLTEASVRTLLERGLTQTEGGFVFSRDLRVNFKNIVRTTLEQGLEMQSRIQAAVLVVLADKGFVAGLSKTNEHKLITQLLQDYRGRNHSVVTVPGDHHVHLNNPEAVAPLISDFLQTKVLSQQLTD